MKATNHVAMIGIRVSLDKRRQLKSGSYSIVYRISHQRKSTSLASGFTCKPEEWDEDKECFKLTKGEGLVNSKRLLDKKVSLMQRAMEYERKHGDSGNLKSIKQFLTGCSQTNTTVQQFWNSEIKRLEESKLYGNARNYKSALGGITGVICLEIPFSHIDYSWLVSLETSLRKKGVSANGIAVYMRHLRSIINRAIDHEIIDDIKYPFKRFKIKTEPTTPRPISLSELQSLFQYKSKNKKEEFAKDCACLIFMLRGINFADLAVLTKSNLKGDRIIYNRQKTGKLYSVKIEDEVKVLLDKYVDANRNTLLPILTGSEESCTEDIIPIIMQRRKLLNKKLKLIGKVLGIGEPLTTYVFRYTHANLCKQLGYSKDMISESLGHGYGLAVSSSYLESYDLELIDEMNKRVVQEVINP